MQEPLWTCIPFVGMLLSIALFPILNPRIWEKHMPLITGFWAVLAVVLLSVKYGIASGLETAADGIVNDYLTFIVLLLGLYYDEMDGGYLKGSLSGHRDQAEALGEQLALQLKAEYGRRNST